MLDLMEHLDQALATTNVEQLSQKKTNTTQMIPDKTVRLVASGSERTNFPRNLLILCNIFLTELPPTYSRTYGLGTHIHCTSRKWMFWSG